MDHKVTTCSVELEDEQNHFLGSQCHCLCPVDQWLSGACRYSLSNSSSSRWSRKDWGLWKLFFWASSNPFCKGWVWGTDRCSGHRYSTGWCCEPLCVYNTQIYPQDWTRRFLKTEAAFVWGIPVERRNKRLAMWVRIMCVGLCLWPSKIGETLRKKRMALAGVPPPICKRKVVSTAGSLWFLGHLSEKTEMAAECPGAKYAYASDDTAVFLHKQCWKRTFALLLRRETLSYSTGGAQPGHVHLTLSIIFTIILYLFLFTLIFWFSTRMEGPWI